MIEASASISFSKARLISSLSGAALTAVLSKGDRLTTIIDYLRQDPIGKQPFGLVMVCIGPKGLPDDVLVIAISQLAREKNRPEYAVIQELREQGCLLYKETDFSLLIDRVVVDIRAGRLHLPISREKLYPNRVFRKLRFIPVGKELS